MSKLAKLRKMEEAYQKPKKNRATTWLENMREKAHKDAQERFWEHTRDCTKADIDVWIRDYSGFKSGYWFFGSVSNWLDQVQVLYKKANRVVIENKQAWNESAYYESLKQEMYNQWT